MGLITITGLLILILILDALRNHISLNMKHDCAPRRKKKKNITTKKAKKKNKKYKIKKNPKTSGTIQTMIPRVKRMNIQNTDL